jgi:hypothetical protein
VTTPVLVRIPPCFLHESFKSAENLPETSKKVIETNIAKLKKRSRKWEKEEKKFSPWMERLAFM